MVIGNAMNALLHLDVDVAGVGKVRLPVGGNDGSLPAMVARDSITLLEQTIGPRENCQRGTKWSPVREVLLTHGAFHG